MPTIHVRPSPVLSKLALLAALVSPWANTGAAEPDAWSLDPVHTRVMFAISHAGFSQALGTVSGSEGVLLFDPDDWGSARLEATVPMALLNLGDTDWNEAALAPNLLDGRDHPTAHFRSTSVTGHDAGHARVCGELTLRAVTRPLCMEVSLNAVKRHPMPPFRRTVGFSATATLSRSEFGIDAWQSMIGDEVELRIEAEAVRTRRSAAADLLQPTPSTDVAPEEVVPEDPVPETLRPATLPVLPVIPPITEFDDPEQTRTHKEIDL